MAGDIKLKYGSLNTYTVTNLQTLAASASWIAGWGSASVDNTSGLSLDYEIGGTFTTAGSNRQAGVIEVWAVGSLSGTTFFAPASGTAGTEGAVGFTAREQLIATGRLLASISVLSTNSQIYAFPATAIAALFNGSLPPAFYLFVTTNAATSTNAAFASAAIYGTPVIAQYT